MDASIFLFPVMCQTVHVAFQVIVKYDDRWMPIEIVNNNVTIRKNKYPGYYSFFAISCCKAGYLPAIKSLAVATVP
jgi:hypothetical protein